MKELAVMVTAVSGDGDPPRTRRRAIQITEDVHALECSPSMQARKEGWYLDGRRMGPVTMMVSPLLPGVTLETFPDNFSFGNHGTNGSVGLRIDGETRLTQISWCVFPPGYVPSEAQFYRLREIFEGIPPGNPERMAHWDWPCQNCDGSDPEYHRTHAG